MLNHSCDAIGFTWEQRIVSAVGLRSYIYHLSVLAVISRWIKSEVDLDEEVKRWTQVAASPSLFPLLFESGAFDLLTSLLSHANTDLAIDAMEVFSELTEADSVMEAPDPQAVVDQLVGK